MFYILYYISGIILIPGIIFSIYCQIKINTTYKKYSKIQSKSGWVANEMSQMLLEKANCNVRVTRIPGNLTDNYNPTNQVLSLSDTVYNSQSIAALAVAAHEVGHAIQHNEDYTPLKFRSFMVKVVNFGSILALPLALIGVILTWLATEGSPIGEFLINLGIIAYSLTTIFALITLPVELNASNRAKKLLVETGVLDSNELKGASKVLTSAALTYVASLLVSLLYLIRFIFIISSLKRDD